MMKILILSTDTDYHRYFINSINQHFEVIAVVFETYKRNDPFERVYPFPDLENQFNEKFWENGISRELIGSIPVYSVHRVNDERFLDIIAQISEFDIGLVWGCGKIKPHIFKHFKLGLINVHRGIAQFYRGLDTEYWAIYHEDFDNIGVTLHYIEEELDTGAIVCQDFVSINASTKIYQLKYLTSVMATTLMIQALKSLQAGTLQPKTQPTRGRYYSAMPTVLIDLCVQKFNRYVHLLQDSES